MRIEVSFSPALDTAAGGARAAEAVGFDGLWVAEVDHDPFIPLTLAAEHTEHVSLGTNIAVAFARNPMTLAVLGNDLQQLSGGRFVLGLGSQIRPHITKRFSMPWSEPAARMEEMVRAIRAIWHTFATNEPLAFRGRFYTHTLMTPFFNPGPNAFGAPPIFLAAVGPRMVRVAAEVADGLLVHPFSTERYLREVTLPGVEAALAAAGRSRDNFEISVPLFVVTGDTEDEVAAAAAAVRMQLAFYGSTPAYRRVLELHGWGDLGVELNTLSKRGQWLQMAGLIDDEVLSTFAVVADPADVAIAIAKRYSGTADRLNFPASSDRGGGEAWWARVLGDLRQVLP